MKYTSVQNVIFDLDGTLIDSSPGILASLTSALESSGITPNQPLDSSLIGPPLREMILSLVDKPTEAQFAYMTEAFKTHYDAEGFKSSLPYPGVSLMLKRLLANHVRLHIVTNKRARPTRLILSHLNWTSCFLNVYSPDSIVPPSASKAELLGAFLLDTGIIPEQCIYIGDRVEDWHSARSNHVRFVWARWGFSGDDLRFDDNSICLAVPDADLLSAHLSS